MQPSKVETFGVMQIYWQQQGMILSSIDYAKHILEAVNNVQRL